MKIAINGFGRIGRLALRLISERSDIEVVAINDLTDALQLAYLYKYDSVHRTNKSTIEYDEDSITIDGKDIKIYSEEDPENLPWRDLEVDVVLECTGAFTQYDKAYKHIKAGAKKVLISAPGKGEMKTIVYNVNNYTLDGEEEVISAASCTTNCLAPILNVLHQNFKVKKGFMSTVHAITNDQETLDIPHKKGIESRRGRAASLNIIPTSTGAAKAIGEVIPELKGCLEGSAFRVPVADGSMIDLTVLVEKETTEEEVNQLLKDNQNETLKFTNAPIVSSDIIGDKAGAIVDGLLTKVLDKNLIKVVAWYDNEMGYTAQMVRTLEEL